MYREMVLTRALYNLNYWKLVIDKKDSNRTYCFYRTLMLSFIMFDKILIEFFLFLSKYYCICKYSWLFF